MARKILLALGLALFSPMVTLAVDDMFDVVWGLFRKDKGEANDLERAECYGNVRSVSEYKTKKTEDGKYVKGDFVCTYVFDKQKRIIEYIRNREKYTFSYDSLGHCVERKGFYLGDEQKLESRRIRRYNAQGNLLTDRSYRHNALKEERRYIYDEANRLVCSTKIYDGELSKVLHITYDKKGNMVDSSEYDKDRDSMVLGDYTRKEYDGEGKLLSMEKKHIYYTTREVYSYDEAGRLEMKSLKSIGGISGSDSLTFHYGKDGRLFSMDSASCGENGICGEKISTSYYDSLERRVSKRLGEWVDSTVYDAKGRVVRMFGYNPKTGYTSVGTNISYSQKGNIAEKIEQTGRMTGEKWIYKYKNGYETERIHYVKQDGKYRKLVGEETFQVYEEDSDISSKQTAPVYEYVDKPWAESRIVKKYDKWGNITYGAIYSEGKLSSHSVCTYQGFRRPLKLISYYRGEVSSTTDYKTDKYGNLLEMYTYGEYGEASVIKEYEYYDE